MQDRQRTMHMVQHCPHSFVLVWWCLDSQEAMCRLLGDRRLCVSMSVGQEGMQDRQRIMHVMQHCPHSFDVLGIAGCTTAESYEMNDMWCAV